MEPRSRIRKGCSEGRGKNLRHVKLYAAADLERKGRRELVVAASRLESQAPLPGMSGKPPLKAPRKRAAGRAG